MNYYIATSILRAKEHNLVRDSLKKLGHVLTYDWTVHGSVKLESKERLQEVAVSECRGLVEADVVVVLLPGGGGTHFELGFSIASGKKVFLHSEDPLLFELGAQTNAFYHHPELIRLTMPLADVGFAVNASILETLLV